MEVEQEESESEDEGAEIMSQIIDHGLKTGNFDEPSLSERLRDYLKKNVDKPVIKPKKVSFHPRQDTKKQKKLNKAIKQRIPVRGLPKSSESDGSEERDYFPLGQNWPDEGPVVLSSIPQKPLLEDDTPIFDDDTSIDSDELPYETSGEEAIMLKMAQLCIYNKEKIVDDEKTEVLSEIERDLKNLPMLDQRITNDAWRSFFLLSNKSDIVSEEDLLELLKSFLK
jgi:hypothetical protein